MRYTRLRRAIESGTLIGTHGTPFQGADKIGDKIADAPKKRKKSPAASDEQDSPIAQKHANVRESRKSKSSISPSYFDEVAQTSDTKDARMEEDHGSVNQAHLAPIKSEPFDPDNTFHLSMSETTSKGNAPRHLSGTIFPNSFASSQESSPSPREPKRRRSHNTAETASLQQQPSLHSFGPTGYHEPATPAKARSVSKPNPLSAKSGSDHNPFDSPASLKFEDDSDATIPLPALEGS